MLTYSTTKQVNLLSRLKMLSSTNLYYASLILLLLNKEPKYIVLASNLEYTSISFLHIYVLYLVLLQFLQRCIAS
jgi:hypothetical protein